MLFLIVSNNLTVEANPDGMTLTVEANTSMTLTVEANPDGMTLTAVAVEG